MLLSSQKKKKVLKKTKTGLQYIFARQKQIKI